MCPKVSRTLALTVLALSFIAGHGAQAAAATSTNTLAHCNWGEIGCTNPPPKAPSPATRKAARDAGSAPSTPAQPQVLTGGPQRAKLACNKDLSTPDECWTNCKTEDDITICDIIRLDTFMPEAPGGGLAFSGKTVKKVYRGGRTAVGRIMAK